MPPNYFEIKVFSSVCQGINHLHMDGRYCDLSVTVGTSSFSCHRLVLASVSEYFRDVLPDENEAGVICVQDERVPEEIFALILDAVYKGTNIVKDIPTAKTLVRAAAFLKIKFLIELCEEFLRDNIDTENFLDLWQFGDRYDLTVLMEGAAEKVSSRFDEFRETESFLQLPKQFLFAILSSDSLQASSDEDVCKALLQWVEYAAEHRSCHLPEILPFIRFCNFSEKYIWKLKYNVALFEYIQEAMQVKYETSEKINSLKKTKILSRQERITAADNMKRVTILLDRTTETGITIVKLDMHPDNCQPDTFTPHPVDCGPGFASYVWRNELYVSGGSEKPKFFAVYNSGIDKWKTLSDLPNGRERHAMTGVNWNIYVLGGLEESPDGQKVPAAQVMTFNLRSKTWSVTANLCKAVQQIGVAVLGQKIYVFGGRDADDNVTSLVQCVDTLTGCVYHAGQLPSPTCGACPLVSAGVIYLVRSEGDVLQMRERSIEVTELQGLEGQPAKQEPVFIETEKYLSVSDKQGSSLATVCCSEHTEVQMQNDFSGQRLVTENKISTGNLADSVRFIHIADVSKRQYFSAVLQGEKIQICGGQNEAGTLLQDVEELDLKTREITMRAGILPRPMSQFGVHLLNVPSRADTVHFKFSFRPDTLLTERNVINSPFITFNKVSWYLQCRVQSDRVEVQLCTEQPLFDSKLKQNVKYVLWIVPKKPESTNYYIQFLPPKVGFVRAVVEPSKTFTFNVASSATFTAVRTNSCFERWDEFISMQELTNPNNGYLENGEVTFRTTITVPPVSQYGPKPLIALENVSSFSFHTKENVYK